ncbi:MAG: PPOX class F420-dependent enzyme [Micrococcales bacterium 70-64]|nr:PPOX class F420-dependent oxidoreductase [Leifsonia sp.]ODU63472.1 MAG: PPOX class F420-dependent enzyme [Leifsonia sp. SCN 70-46]OJX85163.1 MAG: PPOX class F420-dependent enzyme [Micrococcales bacterium 70-64]
MLTPDGLDFVTERHLATLTTLGPDGRFHVVPVGFTYRDGLVRIITSGPSQKVANLRRDARATVSQVDGGRWLTLAGSARILDDPDSVALAVGLYAQRYRQPRVNPLRVAIEVTVETALGSAGLLAR